MEEIDMKDLKNKMKDLNEKDIKGINGFIDFFNAVSKTNMPKFYIPQENNPYNNIIKDINDLLLDMEHKLESKAPSENGKKITDFKITYDDVYIIRKLLDLYISEVNMTKNAIDIIKKTNDNFKNLSDEEIRKIIYGFDKCADIKGV